MSEANGTGDGELSARDRAQIETVLNGPDAPPVLPPSPALPGDDVRTLRAELRALRAELPDLVRLVVFESLGPRCGRCGTGTPVLPVEYVADEEEHGWRGWRLVPAAAAADWRELPPGVVSRICAGCARRVVLRQLVGASQDRVAAAVMVQFGPDLVP